MESCLTATYQAGQDLSAKQYHFVSLATDGQIDPTADGALAVGVLQNAPEAAGHAATVVWSGISRVCAGAAFEEGTPLAANTDGRAVTATAGEFIMGIAKEQATANGDIVLAQINVGAAKAS